jgi:nitroreductase
MKLFLLTLRVKLNSFRIFIEYIGYFLSIRSTYNYFDIIRDVHRIEKGLNMIPRRKEFALSYILKLVDSISVLDDADLAWSTSVLSEYFLVTSSSDKDYLLAKSKFNSRKVKEKSDSCYADSDLSEFSDKESALLQLKKRRSVRNYNSITISEFEINEIIENAISITPSACNRGAAKVKVFLGGKKSREIAQIANGTIGWLEEIENVLIVYSEFSDFSEKRDFKLPFIDSSFLLLNIMNVMTLSGISTCIVNWPEIPEKNMELKRKLSLPSSTVIIGLLVFGHGEKGALSPSSKKRSLSRIIDSCTR